MIFAFTLLMSGCAFGPTAIEAPAPTFVDEAQQHELAYQFAADQVDGVPALEVIMHVQTGPTEYTDLAIPESWSPPSPPSPSP